MPIIKSQKKRVLTNEKRRQRNVAVRARVKTYLKRVETAIEQNDAEKIDEAVKALIDDAAERAKSAAEPAAEDLLTDVYVAY